MKDYYAKSEFGGAVSIHLLLWSKGSYDIFALLSWLMLLQLLEKQWLKPSERKWRLYMAIVGNCVVCRICPIEYFLIDRLVSCHSLARKKEIVTVQFEMLSVMLLLLKGSRPFCMLSFLKCLHQSFIGDHFAIAGTCMITFCTFQ
jgi:hypothetical protein